MNGRKVVSVFVTVLLFAGLALILGGALLLTSRAWGRLVLVALLTRALDRPQVRRVVRGRS